MSLPLLDRFPAEIHLYLTEIAERLWAGHAAVMIGAGFSRNATKNDHTKCDFPNWNQLGDILYEKLHGQAPGTSQRYMNILKLADEVQAAFGRPVLDQLIINNLPDQDHSPSDLQIKLLDLPWTDIFTTNYDTLLERAGQQVINYKYNTVLNQQDLIYSEKPRIVKLHGSLPSERPFIISEEDYRRYPLDFAPFVNTVQQSMLENTFCLVGFSADDPNFMKWIGWVCDNLGAENAPKLYLVGLLRLTDAKMKLLATRNIVVVNLASLSEDISHQEALNNFTDFLAAQRKRDQRIGWPGNHLPFHSLHSEKFDSEALVRDWSALRLQYPNWTIFPYFEVQKLWQHTDQAILNADKVLILPEQLDIQYLFELNWRLEKCLVPIYNNLQLAYESILEKYADNRSLADKWLALAFGLWRYYREEGYLEMWQILSDRLAALKLKGSEYQARYHYERCLYHIGLFELAELKAELNHWPVNDALPFWEAKRAALLGELGLINEAVTILERTLAMVRKRSLGIDSISDYTWVSQEAYIMQLLQYVKNSRDAFVFPKNPEEETGFHDRQNKLKLYKCDPWLELDHFNLQLQKEHKNFKDKEIKFGFGLNSGSSTYYLSNDNSYLVNAYQFLRYFEETGIPPRLPHFNYGRQSLTAALKRLAIHSPFWVMTALVRSGDTKMVDQVFDRETIRDLKTPKISVLVDHLLAMLRHFLNSKDTTETLQLAGLSGVMPLILSRLVVRCDPQQQRQVLELILNIFRSGQQQALEGQKELLRHLINSMDNELNFELLPLYLEFPINPEEDRLDQIPDPFDYLRQPGEDKDHDEVIVEPSVINNLLKLARGNGLERSRAVTRLLVLYRLRQLSKKELEAFGQALWSNLATDGFPADSNLLKFSYINLAHPKGVDPVKLYKCYILAYEPPIQGSNVENSIDITGGKLPALEDLVGGTKGRTGKYGVTWTREENIQIFKKMQRWWAEDKHYLLAEKRNGFGLSVPQEFRRRFANLLKVLSKVLYLNNFWSQEPYRSQMQELILDMDNHGMIIDELKFKYRELFNTELEFVYKAIESSLASYEEIRVLEACNTIIVIINDPEIRWDDPAFRHLIDIITDQIKWRNTRIIVRCLEITLIIVKGHKGLFTPDNYAGILWGLDFLLTETVSGMDQLDITERLNIRKKSAALSYALYCHYNSIADTVPRILLNWKEACQALHEFNEIKLEWPDKI